MTTKYVDRKVPGYIKKPKGAYNIAYKLGWIDASKKNAEGKIVSWEGISMKGTPTYEAPEQPQERQCCQGKNTKLKKNRDPSTTLWYILGNCEHFKNEKTKL